MEGQMHLSGQLTDWSINDLLQIMQVTNKTGSLDIEGERRGRIHFREGTVTGAELSGAVGSVSGTDRAAVADILYVLSSMEDGAFSVGPADGPEDGGWVVEDVLSDLEALKSLEGEVVESGLLDAPGVRLVQKVSDPITVSPDEWAVMATLVQPFTFVELEMRMGRGGAIRVLHTLDRLGAIEAIAANLEGEEDGETQWLDRLAGDISPESSEPTWLELDADADPDAATTEETSEKPEPVAVASADDAVEPAPMRGVSAPASTTLTDGVYDEIRRLRSKVAER